MGWEEQDLGRNVRYLGKRMLVVQGKSEIGRAGFGKEHGDPGEDTIGGEGKKLGWEEQDLGRNVRSLLMVHRKGAMGRAGFGKEHGDPGEKNVGGMGRRWSEKSRVWGGMPGPWRRQCWWCRGKVDWEEQDLGRNVRSLLMVHRKGAMGRAGFGKEHGDPGEKNVGGMGRRWTEKSRVWGEMSGPWRRVLWWCRERWDGKSRIWGGISRPWRRYHWWHGEKVGWEEQDLGRNVRYLGKRMLVVQGKSEIGRAGFGKEHGDPGEDTIGGEGKKLGWEEQDLGRNVRSLLMVHRKGAMGRAGFGKEHGDPGEKNVGGMGRRWTIQGFCDRSFKAQMVEVVYGGEHHPTKDPPFVG
ncbi:PREDICTED: uncharacterized protein LOC101809329 [Ficedula albicollis]|uniref:uncharacterized protein LOC101809329 n=1 Tax=Ficedula albicollis TaxID=59894 RepID=UPI0003597420|nr:PREDICTED: uncharacterized protein LOC101809329 [Ficedula albicollis]